MREVLLVLAGWFFACGWKGIVLADDWPDALARPAALEQAVQNTLGSAVHSLATAGENLERCTA